MVCIMEKTNKMKQNDITCNNTYNISCIDGLSILSVQEEERQRIAMELHDTSLQTLAHVIHQVDLASIYMDTDIVRSKLELAEVKQNIKVVIEEIRNTIFDLRPMSFDDLGIEEAIQRYIQCANKDHSFRIHTDIGNIDTTYCLIKENIYRIIQECVSNAIKHSSGDEIYLNCYSENKICHIDISDNGKGIADKKNEEDGQKHFGLFVVRERVMILGGEIQIASEIDKGTKISITIPLK